MFLDWFFIKDFQPWEIAVVIASGLFIGMGKTGLNGINSIMIPLLAIVFGAKESTGIVLPMMCFADIIAVLWYRRSAEWKHIARLMPWAMGGLVLALVVERFVPAQGFKYLIGFCIFSGLGVMIWNDAATRKLGDKQAMVPSGWWFSAIFGLLGGFSTMIGNAAGPIMSVFLLSMKLPKENFLGTAAWFYMIVNYTKIPLQIIFWHNITVQGLLFNVCMIPVIIAGTVLGVVLVKLVSEKVYRTLVYAMTIVSATLLFINFS
ncbi:MAG: sulfite exporter TauE/SafE family protein [Treponema sp.]|nr:sulfite exporter TauE/SafE family protein [Treponema sp.]